MKNNEDIVVPQAAPKKVVVILGNGFDLDLHYVTSYKNFVESDYFKPMLTGVEPDFLIEGRDKMQIHPNHLAEYILEFNEHNNWVDLEICVRDYCKAHVNDINNEIIAREFHALRFFLYQYILRAYHYRNQAGNPGERRTECAWRLLNWLSRSYSDWNIWTFNYTFNCEDILKKLIADEKVVRDRVHYIHGNISKKNGCTDIVLGTGYDPDVMQVCPNAIKSQWEGYQPLKLLYDKQVSEADMIVIMGHSVGATDSQYFNKLVDTSLKCIFIINQSEESCSTIKKNLDKWTNNKFGNLTQDGSLYCSTYIPYPDSYSRVFSTADESLEKLLSECLERTMQSKA